METWRGLGTVWTKHRAAIPAALAVHVSSRYFSGVRFAQPRYSAV